MKVNLTFAIIFLTILVYANVNEMNGIVGLTKFDGGLGCQCHSLTPNDSVFVLIEGPDTMYRSDTAQFKISIYGGSEVVGGFNLASYLGGIYPLDTLTHLELNTATSREELTHSFPFPFLDGEVYWLFNYIAPDSIIFDTLFATGNSCNGDGIPTNFDQWNHSENFIVNVIDRPVYVENDNSNPDDFVLYQNYPNPFNPTTKIKFLISDFGFVSLKIYDVLGNEVVTLVDEYKSVGEYEVEFNVGTSLDLSLPSGVYFYQLRIKTPFQKDSFGGTKSRQEIIQTKKMVLLK